MGAITHPKGPLASKDLNNFQPRVGLAWQITPNLVFRSSFGLITQDLMTNGLNQNFEEYFATASVQAPPGDPRPVFQLSQGPPPFQFNIAARRFGAVRRARNFANRNASWFDPEHADAVHHELVRRLPVELHAELAAGSDVSGLARRAAAEWLGHQPDPAEHLDQPERSADHLPDAARTTSRIRSSARSVTTRTTATTPITESRSAVRSDTRRAWC